jgi:putative endonuclease
VGLTPRWSVYVLRCGDGTLYCGIALDVAARLARHEAGKGARYTRGRGPLTLLRATRCRSQGEALRVERAVKALSRPDKEQLVARERGLTALATSVRRAYERSR